MAGENRKYDHREFSGGRTLLITTGKSSPTLTVLIHLRSVHSST